jgi:hypothetical protein
MRPTRAACSTSTDELHQRICTPYGLVLARSTTRSRDRASIDEPALAARRLVGDVRGKPAVHDAAGRAGCRPGLLVAGATDRTGGRRPTPAPLEVR